MIHDPDHQIAVPEKYFFYYSLFKYSPVGMGVADFEGNLIDFNNAILEPGGYTREDIEQIRNVTLLYFDPAEREVAMRKARAEGGLNRFPVKFKRKDGGSYDTLMTLRPITYEDRRYWMAIVEAV